MTERDERWILELMQVDSHVHFRLRDRDHGLCHSNYNSELTMRHGQFVGLWMTLRARIITSDMARHIGPIYGPDSDETKAVLAMYHIAETPAPGEGEAGKVRKNEW